MTLKKLNKLIALTFIGSISCTQTYALDLEVDPIAYGLNGYSLHLGLGQENFRFDLGVFGLEMSDSFTSNENFEVDFEGYGVKLDYLFGSYQRGFVGIQAASSKVGYKLKSSGTKKRLTQVSFGPRVGYRFILDNNITITPWIALDFNLDKEDIIIDNEKYEADLVTIFPTVHLGWRF